MIDLIFSYANEMVFVRVDGNNIKFASSLTPNMWASIDGLKLSHNGVLKEHPDLINNPEWKTIAIQRFKDKIKSFDTETKKGDYIIQDLESHGYELKRILKAGFRGTKR